MNSISNSRQLETTVNKFCCWKITFLLICFAENTVAQSDFAEATTPPSVVDAAEVFFFPETTTLIDSYASYESFTTQSPITSEEEFLESVRRPVKSCECGVSRNSAAEPITRVIGGQPARHGEFPWFTAIAKFQHNKHPRWKVVCGGALISEEFVITAAHCLHNRFKETLQVNFNVRDANNITADSSVVKHKIKDVLLHPEYNPKTQDNDIALIRLKAPISNSVKGNIVPICLPETSISFERNGTFVGFGHTQYGSGTPGPKENSRVLLKVDLPILTHSECLMSKVPTKKNVTSSMICAGGQGKDACINDSGGPLMTQQGGKTVVVGLASWGIGCGLPDYPGVYTKVSQYLNWIKLAVSKNSQNRICSAWT